MSGINGKELETKKGWEMLLRYSSSESEAYRFLRKGQNETFLEGLADYFARDGLLQNKIVEVLEPSFSSGTRSLVLKVSPAEGDYPAEDSFIIMIDLQANVHQRSKNGNPETDYRSEHLTYFNYYGIIPYSYAYLREGQGNGAEPDRVVEAAFDRTEPTGFPERSGGILGTFQSDHKLREEGIVVRLYPRLPHTFDYLETFPESVGIRGLTDHYNYLLLEGIEQLEAYIQNIGPEWRSRDALEALMDKLKSTTVEYDWGEKKPMVNPDCTFEDFEKLCVAAMDVKELLDYRKQAPIYDQDRSVFGVEFGYSDEAMSRKPWMIDLDATSPKTWGDHDGYSAMRATLREKYGIKGHRLRAEFPGYRFEDEASRRAYLSATPEERTVMLEQLEERKRDV